MNSSESFFSGISSMFNNEFEKTTKKSSDTRILGGLSQLYSIKSHNGRYSSEESKEEELYSFHETYGARGFASRSGNSSINKPTLTSLSCKDASHKNEAFDMQEKMQVIMKSPALWSEFKTRLSSKKTNHGGIVTLQIVLQEFVNDHPEIEGSLHALKRKKDNRRRGEERSSSNSSQNKSNNTGLIGKLSSMILGNNNNESKKKSNVVSRSSSFSQLKTVRKGGLKRSRTFPLSRTEAKQAAIEEIMQAKFDIPRIVAVPSISFSSEESKEDEEDFFSMSRTVIPPKRVNPTFEFHPYNIPCFTVFEVNEEEHCD